MNVPPLDGRRGLTIACYCGHEALPSEWVWSPLPPDLPLMNRLREAPELLQGCELVTCPRCGRRLLFRRHETPTARSYTGPLPMTPDELPEYDRFLEERYPGMGPVPDDE